MYSNLYFAMSYVGGVDCSAVAPGLGRWMIVVFSQICPCLEARACPFVPRLLEFHPERLSIVTTSCGSRVEHLDDQRLRELFGELEAYGVRHDDPEMRNVTYRQADGRFCVIDFEFAMILPD